MEKKCYIITYDLLAPGRDYDALYKAIRAYGTWGRITESCWVIVTSERPSTIRSNLALFMDANDRVFVARLTVPAAWKNTKADDEWVKRVLETFGQ